jgi:AcrR family transcriptional regulator
MVQTRIKGPARRERLLDAAAQIVLAHGAAAVTMEAVALRNGINRAMAYRYFADRDDLLGQLLHREYGRQTEHIAAQTDAVADLEGAMRYALRHWFLHGQLFLKLANDTGPLAVRAAAIRRADALFWADALAKTFSLPHDVSFRLAAFVVGGAYGVLETRTGEDDDTVIDNVVLSVMAAGQALKTRHGNAMTRG